MTLFYRHTRTLNDIPMTSAQYLLWRARRRPRPIDVPTPADAAAAVIKLQGAPFWRDTVESDGGGDVDDEVDAGYLAAIRKAPAVVGTGLGQVPMEVARRLHWAGLIRKVG